MLKISIYKDSVLTNEASFSTQLELNSWLSYHQSLGSFGVEAIYENREVLIQEEVRGEVYVLVQEAEYDQFGEEMTPAIYEIDPDGVISPAVYETQTFLVSPREYDIVIEDITEEFEKEQARLAKIEAGRVAREKCEEVLDMIAGFNIDRQLSLQEVTQLQSMLSGPESALRSGRPSMAKQLISAVVPDGDLVTREMKDLCLQVLASY